MACFGQQAVSEFTQRSEAFVNCNLLSDRVVNPCAAECQKRLGDTCMCMFYVGLSFVDRQRLTCGGIIATSGMPGFREYVVV